MAARRAASGWVEPSGFLTSRLRRRESSSQLSNFQNSRLLQINKSAIYKSEAPKDAWVKNNFEYKFSLIIVRILQQM